MSLPVLVLGTHLTALGVFRTLARRRVPAYGLDATGDIVTRSRWYRAAERQIAETADSAVLEAFLMALGLPSAVLIACNDNWTRAAAGLSAVARARFPMSLPSRDVVETFTDKQRFRAFVEGLGIPTPRTFDVPDAAALDAVPDEALRDSFLKPTDSPRFTRRFATKGWFPESRAHAHQLLERGEAAGVEFILQEWIPGGFSRSVLVDGFVDRRGRIVSMTARRRLRMDPPRLANNSCGVTIPLRDVGPAAAMTRQLLDHSGYRGIYSVEFKHDPRDGLFKVIEMNARPFWYVAHVAHAGVDLPWMSYLDAQGLPVPAPTHYDLGRYSVYEAMDVAAVLRALRSRHRPNGPVLRPWVFGDRAAFWWSDPLPGVVDFWNAVRARLAVTIRGRAPNHRGSPGSAGHTA